MSDEALKKAVREAVTEALKPVEERLEKLEGRVESAYKIRNVALITAAFCLIAASFSVGYAVNSRKQLNSQLDTNQQSLCSSARQTALAFRAPQEDSRTGRKETRRHYLERLVGQRETLRAAAGLECPSLKGFATFPFLRGKALVEIEGILYRLAPRRFGPPEGARTRARSSAGRPLAAGGDASQAGSTGYQPSSPRNGGSVGAGETEQTRGKGGGGSKGGQGKPPAGTPTTPDPAPVPSASSPSPSPGRSSDAPGDPEPKGDPPGALPSTLEATGAAVKEAGEGVGGAVEGVGKGVDCALRGSC